MNKKLQEFAHSLQLQSKEMYGITEKIKDLDNDTCLEELVKYKKEYINIFAKSIAIIKESNIGVLSEISSMMSNISNKDNSSKDIKLSNDISNMACDMIIDEITKDPEVNVLETIIEVCEELMIDVADMETLIAENPVFRQRLGSHLNNNNVCKDIIAMPTVDKYF